MIAAEYKLVCTKGCDEALKALAKTLTTTREQTLVLEGIPVAAIEDFIKNKRDNLTTYEIVVEGEEPVELAFTTASKDDAKFLLGMFKQAKSQNIEMDTLEVAPISLKNFEEYIGGARDSLISFTLGKLEPGDEEIEKLK